MSEYVKCVAKVTLTAEDPLWRRICRIAAQHGERPEELVGFLAGDGGSICGRCWTATIRRRV